MDSSVKEEDEDDKDMEMCMSFEHRIRDLPDYEHSREDNREEGVVRDESAQLDFSFKLPKGYSSGIFVMVQVGSTKNIYLVETDKPQDTRGL
ncbi:hypothetical protein RHMOL_Rhmol05G0036300 [Rhododendron molle]|uniref:Uncharacterized protein n=2 Tax=Rhododendron molle TaxID=49168 RepID=A0ACC0NKB3_RHOML|nr:hypothetical protein RHMOL_Rhmol05G0036300 [Rhododendron molle]KAI8553692.1 hypothetical protein RHMOL_Rhmol05G0036300 [Rhododendron molle]